MGVQEFDISSEAAKKDGGEMTPDMVPKVRVD